MIEGSELTDNEIEYLQLIMNGYTSSYSIWSYLKQKAGKDPNVSGISYKNVNKRFIKLIKIKAIEEIQIPGTSNIHGRKDFRVSLIGLEQLIPYLLQHPNEIENIIKYMDKFNLDKVQFGRLLAFRSIAILRIKEMFHQKTGLPQSSEVSFLKNIILTDKKTDIRTYPMIIDFTDYLVQVLMFKPYELSHSEREVLSRCFKNESQSVDQIIKKLETLLPYKNKDYRIKVNLQEIHVSINKLIKHNYIERLKVNINKATDYYKITDYGLISYLNKPLWGDNWNDDFFNKNTDSIVFRSLLSQFFEDKTIHSLRLDFGFKDELNDTLNDLIKDYLRKCCYDTIDYGNWWIAVENDINNAISLPSDKTIQEYMLYLGGKSIVNQQSVLNEVKTYEKHLKSIKLTEVLENNINDYNYARERDSKIKDWYKAPYPLGVLYAELINTLGEKLKKNIKRLITDIVLYLADIVISHKLSENDLRRRLDDKNSLVSNLLTDEKFIKLKENIINEFNIGAKQFTYLNKLERPKERTIKLKRKTNLV